MTTPSRPIEDAVEVCVRIPSDMLAVVRALADAEDRSVAWVIRRAVWDYLNAREAAR